MSNLNMANRQVCDLDIRVLSNSESTNMKPFLFFDTANVTTVGITSDSVYAMKKGSRAIAFQNPIEGTLTVETQVFSPRFLALMTDGVIESSATYAKKETITCATAGTLSIPNANAGTVSVFASGEYGGDVIDGTFADGTFTATTASDIAVDSDYEVGYMITKSSGVQKISFNEDKLPSDYYITALTLDKTEDGVLAPFIMTAYKASIQRNFELSFSSEGDPASVTLTFDLMSNKDNNVLDLVMLEDDE